MKISAIPYVNVVALAFIFTGGILCSKASADDLPELIRSQWKFSDQGVKPRWDAQNQLLEFHLLEKEAIIQSPSDLGKLSYRFSFHSPILGSSVGLVVDDNENSASVLKALKNGKSRNPQVYLISRSTYD